MRFIRHTDGQIRALTDFVLYDGRTIAAGTLGGFIESVRNLSQSGSSWVFPGASIEGNAHVSGNAIIQSGSVAENARVYGNAVIDGAIVAGNARVLGNAFVQKGEHGFFFSRAANTTDSQWATSVAAQQTAFLQSVNTWLATADTFLATKSPTGYMLMPSGVWTQFSAAKRIIAQTSRNISGTVIAGEAQVSGDAKVLNNGKILGKAKVQGEAVIAGGVIAEEVKISGRPLLQGFITDQANVAGCAFVNHHSVVMCDARLSGCARLIDAVLTCNAVVYNDNEVDNEVISDAGLVTTCPDKGTRKCCD